MRSQFVYPQETLCGYMAHFLVVLIRTIRFLKLGLKKVLEDGEKVIADQGYADERVHQAQNRETIDARIRPRHETSNRRLKGFFVISHRSRHDLSRHSACFMAVVNATPFGIENGDPLFRPEQ